MLFSSYLRTLSACAVVIALATPARADFLVVTVGTPKFVPSDFQLFAAPIGTAGSGYVAQSHRRHLRTSGPPVILSLSSGAPMRPSSTLAQCGIDDYLHVEDFRTHFVSDSMQWGQSVWAYTMSREYLANSRPGERDFGLGYDAIFGSRLPVTIRQQQSGANTEHPDVIRLIKQRGRLDPTSTLHQGAEEMARRLGFEGEVIVLRGGNVDTGAQMYHSMPRSHGGRTLTPREQVLLLYEENYARGWSRMGNTLHAEAQVGHELGHLSPTLPPKYEARVVYNSLDPNKFYKEAAASQAGADLPRISPSAR